MFLKGVRALWTGLPPSEKRITMSTLFTLARIGLTPIIVMARVSGAWSLACLLFVVAAATDFIDGFLARIRNEQTLLGALLDPIADKILIVSCFAVFALRDGDGTGLAVPVWFVVTMLVKELVLCIGALCVYIHRKSIEVTPTMLGKATTAIQLVVIAWLFACHFFVWMPIRTHCFVMMLLFCLIGITLIQYGRIGLRLWYGDEYV